MDVQFIAVIVRVFFYCCLCAANIPIVPMFQPHILSRGIRPKILPHSKESQLSGRSNPLISPRMEVGGAKLVIGALCMAFCVSILVWFSENVRQS